MASKTLAEKSRLWRQSPQGKAYQKAYAAANAEKLAAYGKAYREANRDKKRARDAERKVWQTPERKAYMRAWHKENPRDRSEYKKAYDEANREKNAAYRAANKERLAAKHREYYQNNLEKRTAYARRYYAENTDRVKANAAHQAARRRGAEGSHTLAEWRAKCEEYDHLCAYCGEPKKLTRDHVIPVSKGGSDFIDNIVPACASCNSKKRARLPEEFPLARAVN